MKKNKKNLIVLQFESFSNFNEEFREFVREILFDSKKEEENLKKQQKNEDILLTSDRSKNKQIVMSV
jgi:hypothetical protein